MIIHSGSVYNLHYVLFQILTDTHHSLVNSLFGSCHDDLVREPFRVFGLKLPLTSGVIWLFSSSEAYMVLSLMSFLWIATSATSFSTSSTSFSTSSSLVVPSVNLYMDFICEDHIVLILILLSEIFVGLERLEVSDCDPAVSDVNFLDLEVAHIVLELSLYLSKVRS